VANPLKSTAGFVKDFLTSGFESAIAGYVPGIDPSIPVIRNLVGFLPSA